MTNNDLILNSLVINAKNLANDLSILQRDGINEQIFSKTIEVIKNAEGIQKRLNDMKYAKEAQC